MTATIEVQQRVPGATARLRLAGAAFVLGGIAFSIGGATHPTDTGEGSKVLQLHQMLVDSSWYPAHALLLLAMALFAVGILAFRREPDLAPGMGGLLRCAFVIACVATAGMSFHLFAALGADSLADGEHTVISRVLTVNESVVQSAWAVAVSALAVLGGLNGTVGNRLTIPFGLLGGVAFAVASLTIPFTDTFDPLFKLGSLIAVWAILTGVIALRSPT